MTVGAVLYSNTPAYGVNPPTIASFSSIGGTPVNGVIRNKPDFTGPNGVNTTVNLGGMNIDGDLFPNFFGTSAAAPHIAGVAALVMEARQKFYSEQVSPQQMRTLLQSTAVDMNTPGFDYVSGYGFVQADSAIRSFASPKPFITNLLLPDSATIPGKQPFVVTVKGNYLSKSSQVLFRGRPLQTTVISNSLASATIPEFTGNPVIQVYTLPLCEVLDDNDAIGTITVNIGEIYLEQDNDTLALQYFKRSLKAYENSKNVLYSLNDIARVYQKRKDYATALTYHQQALYIAEKLSSKLEMAQSYQGIASVYLQMQNIPKALKAYKNAEAIAKEIAANYELEKIYKGLSEAYANTNDYSNAYKYQSLLTAINDTLYNAETDKKLAVLQFNFEIQKKQAEIDLLTKDKILKDLDLKTQATVRNSLIAVLSLVIIIAFIIQKL